VAEFVVIGSTPPVVEQADKNDTETITLAAIKKSFDLKVVLITMNCLYVERFSRRNHSTDKIPI